MEHIIDARAYQCPQPVIMTKKAIDSGLKSFTVIVAQKSALENVSRYVKGLGFAAEIESKSEDFYIRVREEEGRTIDKTTSDGKRILSMEQTENRQVTILITGKEIGRGSEELGAALMKSFLFALHEQHEQVENLIFMNAGVLLTVEGSPVLEQLTALKQQGAMVMSCGMCLDYYGVQKQLVVGEVTNMYQIVELLTAAAKTIIL